MKNSKKYYLIHAILTFFFGTLLSESCGMSLNPFNGAFLSTPFGVLVGPVI